MYRDIILIGPISTGKSSQGALLADALGWPQRKMDDLRWDYYAEIGYDHEKAKRLAEEAGGFVGMYRYWKGFEIHAVERLVADFGGSDCVMDFGGGHSVYEDDALFARARKALEPFENVVLILPSPDLDESVRILKERMGGAGYDGLDFAEHFVKHRSNHDLAKLVVYTKGRTPEETRDDILRLVRI